MTRIHDQLKNRRKELALKQEDMMLRIGMSRQQYQRLELKGNPRLDNLELVAKGLSMELMLIPKEKLKAVRDVLAGKSDGLKIPSQVQNTLKEESPGDPWDEIPKD